ncbi:MAG: acetyl-CoA acetyltransferase [Pseudomonadales bacterium]
MSHTPVIIGIAHVEQRIKDLAEAREPLDLMLQASKKAAADADIPLSRVSSVRVVRGMWPYENPAKVIAATIGADDAQTVLTPFGGNFVQSAVNHSALDIQSGAHDLILITGAECGNVQAKAARQGVELDWQAASGTPDLVIGEDMEMRHEAEKAIRIGRPIQVYPLFETALRHDLGHDVEEHSRRIAELWASFSAVAADNPHAWIREAKSADEIRSPSAINRPVSFPYPKFMNSNNNVDQGAALILCSTERARELGVPEDKWVYPWAGTDGHDHYFVSNRDNLYSSPAIRIAGNRCLDLAGVSVDELDKVDVYSCFPSAVQVAARELKLDTSKPLTVTGGLTWAGGPLNNYVMHSIVRMVELLRAAPAEKGLITANGGNLTKHAFGIYSATAPAREFKHEDVQAEIDATPKREVAMDFAGSATVEAYSVMYQGNDPSKAFLTCLTDDGARTWGVTEDKDLMADMIAREYVGRRVNLNQNAVSFS